MIFLADLESFGIVIIIGIFALIALAAFLIYRFIPGIREEKKPLDEEKIAKEELDRLLVPMDDNQAVNETDDKDIKKNK